MSARTEIVDICRKLDRWSDIIALFTRQKRRQQDMMSKFFMAFMVFALVVILLFDD